MAFAVIYLGSVDMIYNIYHMAAEYEWIPYYNGKHLTYYEFFALVGSTALFVLAFLSFFMYLLLEYLYPQPNYESLRRVGNGQAEKSCADKLKTFFRKAGFVELSLIPVVCQAVDVTSILWGIAGMFGFLAWLAHIEKPTEPIETRDRRFKNKLKKALIISVLFNLFMYKTCLCFFNAEIGYYNHLLGFGINTYVTRMFQMKKACPSGKVCQLYATVPEDASTAFFLNLHTNPDVDEVIVSYRELDSQDPTQFTNVTARTYEQENLEWLGQRKVHSALIRGLKPNTKYQTEVFFQGELKANAIYKTVPDKDRVRMINAGDSGYTHESLNLSRIVATLDPDIFFMGGDLAYDDNMPACVYTWDYFLLQYGRITATLGYLMPIVLTVGNHDVGLNELPHVNISVGTHGPAYHLYFPQHYHQDQQGNTLYEVPPIASRRTFHEHYFGNVHYLCLDSGYMHEFSGYQKEFMIKAFEANREKVKFVNYHVPIYSVCSSFDRSPERYIQALFHWVPNFDKYKVMASFENHVHSFKRTKPLIGNSPAENGTVYLGDGAYGALLMELCHPDPQIDIFDAFQKVNNMWVSDIYQKHVEHIAYDTRRNIIDNFTQNVESYRLKE